MGFSLQPLTAEFEIVRGAPFNHTKIGLGALLAAGGKGRHIGHAEDLPYGINEVGCHRGAVPILHLPVMEVDKRKYLFGRGLHRDPGAGVYFPAIAEERQQNENKGKLQAGVKDEFWHLSSGVAVTYGTPCFMRN